MVLDLSFMVGKIMAVFPAYDLDKLAKLPFCVISPLSDMADRQSYEKSIEFAQGFIASQSEDGMKHLYALRQDKCYISKEKKKELGAEENIKRSKTKLEAGKRLAERMRNKAKTEQKGKTK